MTFWTTVGLLPAFCCWRIFYGGWNELPPAAAAATQASKQGADKSAMM